MTVRYRGELSEAERAELRGLIAGGKALDLTCTSWRRHNYT